MVKILTTLCGFEGDRKVAPDNFVFFAASLRAQKGIEAFKRMFGQCSKPPLATENLLENTDGVLRPHQCSLGAAACCLLFMLTRATLMPPLFLKGRR